MSAVRSVNVFLCNGYFISWSSLCLVCTSSLLLVLLSPVSPDFHTSDYSRCTETCLMFESGTTLPSPKNHREAPTILWETEPVPDEVPLQTSRWQDQVYDGTTWQQQQNEAVFTSVHLPLMLWTLSVSEWVTQLFFLEHSVTSFRHPATNLSLWTVWPAVVMVTDSSGG